MLVFFRSVFFLAVEKVGSSEKWLKTYIRNANTPINRPFSGVFQGWQGLCLYAAGLTKKEALMIQVEVLKSANLGMSPKGVNRESEGRNRKIMSHRHERRKMRECLKRWGWEDLD